MPNTEEILNGLQTIVDNQSATAILWHIVFYFLIICFLVNWHPSNRLLGIFLCLPLVSVAVLAWLYGNPFNGSAFTLLAILLLIFSLRTSGTRISYSSVAFYCYRNYHDRFWIRLSSFHQGQFTFRIHVCLSGRVDPLSNPVAFDRDTPAFQCAGLSCNFIHIYCFWTFLRAFWSFQIGCHPGPISFIWKHDAFTQTIFV